jgi:hypothetical protein
MKRYTSVFDPNSMVTVFDPNSMVTVFDPNSMVTVFDLDSEEAKCLEDYLKERGYRTAAQSKSKDSITRYYKGNKGVGYTTLRSGLLLVTSNKDLENEVETFFKE